MSTQDTANAILNAIYTYERECDILRGDLSQEAYGHRGASMPDAAPTRAGRVKAISAVLAARAGEVSDAELVDLWWETCSDEWAIPDHLMVEFGRAAISVAGKA